MLLQEDAELGKMENVFNAQPDGMLILMEFANKSVHFVELGKKMDNVNHVMPVMPSLMELVLKIQMLSDLHQTVFVPLGKTELVLPVPAEPSLIQMEYADQFQTIVLHGII